MNLPSWLIKRTPKSLNIRNLRDLINDDGLHTVCESAKCPNIGECYSNKVATFMILGDICTRNCGFCAVKSGMPASPDASEPMRIAEAAKKLGLKYVVVTSVTRDDLPDRGAGQFASTIDMLKSSIAGAAVEVLIPDLGGRKELIEKVISAGPLVMNHNIEMVKRLYAKIRPRSDYRTSLNVLDISKQINKNLLTKSGFMLGLGETEKEVRELMSDIRKTGCDILTIGQYIRPSQNQAEVVEYAKPEVFEKYRAFALNLGFMHVEAGPLVRSSYHANHILQTVNL